MEVSRSAKPSTDSKAPSQTDSSPPKSVQKFQLFKSKGNYDEGFEHKPHKELWVSKTESEEFQEKPFYLGNAVGGPLSPGVKDAPVAKVGVLAGSMEAEVASMVEKEERPTETKT